MTTPLTRAANSAAARIKSGWPFEAAVGRAAREYGLSFDAIRAELSRRSSARRRHETIKHSTPAPEAQQQAAQGPLSLSLFDAETPNGYGML